MAERLDAEGKVARDRRIVLDRGRGLSWATIAERHDLSERQCRTVWEQRRTAGQELGEREPVEELRDLIDEIDAAGEACALLIESTKNDSVKVAAIKARLTVLGRKFELLHACGLLPRDLARLGAELDLRQLESAMLTVFDDHGVSDEAAQDLITALEPSHLRTRATPEA